MPSNPKPPTEKVVSISITVPVKVLKRMDDFAKGDYRNRSQMFTIAAMEKLGMMPDEPPESRR